MIMNTDREEIRVTMTIKIIFTVKFTSLSKPNYH